MKLALDQYAHLDSPMHQWHQPLKLVALGSLIFAFAFIESLQLLPMMVIITGVVLGLSRLPLRFVLSRFRYPGLFIATVILVLPLVSGETVIWELAGIAVRQEGLLSVLLIVTRFACILTISLVLFGTAPFLSSIRAMRSLGLPPIIVDMTLLAYRYLESFGETLTTMQRAMKLRGFNAHQFNRRNARLFASLIGSLLVRSYEQSQRVYQAMILRGYGYGLSQEQTGLRGALQAATPAMQFWFWFTCAIALSLVIAEVIS
ncbi:cobalt ECF transporter T component CbiQ [Euhalothece natronophila Z-M001]|uniref:Cobalt ECF transporter T component CbiQ n=1 Tax=Euhalothece natronophila Z-M001 TaxID=522448 RepID=A0A5B8NJV8_9CHRO|nr:cobalt ECF transporter T component CbiQ [Euhalothece natronophila]QDZ39218.1 cobalt ECF transporter T component CbiQ [Euhalothece natronophila Z-M001]